MRVAPRENGHQAGEPGRDPTVPEQEPGNGHRPLDAMRSWLLSGVQFVDRRRRFGAHGRARELLVAGRPAGPDPSERLQTLTSALHRYTVRSGLSELSPEHQRVISLAYLEGRTNREIAAALGVSIRTVRRRLWVALGLLEAYLTRSGAWLLAPLLAAAIYSLSHSARFVRWVSTAANSADKAQRLVATVTAGALATAAVGIVAFTSDTPTPSKSHRAQAAPTIFEIVLPAGTSTLLSPSVPREPLVLAPLFAQQTSGAVVRPTGPAGAAPSKSQDNRGCDGNPTSAPPNTPVGPRHGATGPPVTHPGPGGCTG
jgi:sigma-70-like protein